MRMTKGEKTALALVSGIFGTMLLGWLVSGVGKGKDSLLMPDTIENALDDIVEKLNHQFGKQWVGYGLDFLRAALAKTLPPPLVALVRFVYTVEQYGVQHRLTGDQKKRYAADLYRADKYS